MARGNLFRLVGNLYDKYAGGAAETPQQDAQRARVVEILRARQARPNEWVLDAGCGTGDYALDLAQAEFFVLGLDRSAQRLSRARTKAVGELARRAHFLVASLDKALEFDEAHFDHIICLNVLDAVENPLFTLSEFHRVLNKEGTLVIAHTGATVATTTTAIVRAQQGDPVSQSLWNRLQTVARSYGRRKNEAQSWTTVDLHDMLRLLGFRVVEVYDQPQMMLVAEKE